MEGKIKADRHCVVFHFDRVVMEVVYNGNYLTPPKYDRTLGYVWVLCWIDGVSYMMDILPMDEARHMYE